MKTGLIVVNYNDYKTTKEFVESILNFKIIEKIVIVDNKSTNDSVKQLKTIKNDKIKIIENNSNKGYASGINLGSKYLIDLYDDCNIIVSNSDIVVNDESDIEKLLTYLNSKKNIAVVAPIIKQNQGYDKGCKIVKTWQDILLNIIFLHRFLRSKLIGYKENYYLNKDKTEVEQVSGCFFLIKSEALKKIKYLDEGTFLYYEENILATKLKKNKYKTFIINDVEVFHNHSVVIDKSINKLKKYKILKESQLYFEKNYNNASKFDIMMLKMTSKMTYMIFYIVALLKGGFKK